MDYQITGLSPESFQSLFELSDAELKKRGIRRCIADEKPGFPCRVSLEDAEPGEELLLLPFEHQGSDSPYRASGPIFVRRAVTQRFSAVNTIPEQLRLRFLSVRAYDSLGMMREADVCDGKELETMINRYFTDPAVEYLHVHNARPGCFACRIDRSTSR